MRQQLMTPKILGYRQDGAGRVSQITEGGADYTLSRQIRLFQVKSFNLVGTGNNGLGGPGGKTRDFRALMTTGSVSQGYVDRSR